MKDMHLISINIGKSQIIPVGERQVDTGIDKRAVQKIRIEPLGLVGDYVADQKNHGGPDQAVYVYSAEDYVWWEGQLERKLTPGSFGENLTFSEYGGEVRIGDRFRLGGVVIEATAPRIPCSVFATHMDDPELVKKFKKAGRPGFYARVIETGEVQVGAAIEPIPAPQDYPTILEVYQMHYQKDHPNPETLRWMLASPLAERTRKRYAEWLARVMGT